MPFGCSKDVASSGSIIFLILYAFTILMLQCAEAGELVFWVVSVISLHMSNYCPLLVITVICF